MSASIAGYHEINSAKALHLGSSSEYGSRECSIAILMLVPLEWRLEINNNDQRIVMTNFRYRSHMQACYKLASFLGDRSISTRTHAIMSQELPCYLIVRVHVGLRILAHDENEAIISLEARLLEYQHSRRNFGSRVN